MRLLDASQSDQSLAERADRAGLVCLMAASAVAASAAAISSNLHLGHVGSALFAITQMTFVLLAASVVFRWHVPRADVAGTVSLQTFVSAAAWLAPLAVLCRYASWFSLPAAGIFAVLAARAFRQLPRDGSPAEPAAPFLLTIKRQDARRALAIKTATYLAYGGVALGFTVSVPLAAMLVGSAAAVIAWFQLTPDLRTSPRVNVSIVMALLALILATSVPFASNYGSGSRYQEQADALNDRGSGLHSGVVLMATAKAESQLTAPPSSRRSEAVQAKRVVPLSIPFTGEYWIFYWPRSGPGTEASRFYGNPLTAAYRSTDNDSFIMEARQPLAAPIHAGCCRALDVVFDSRDPQPENVLLELVLLDSSASEPQRLSLGAVALTPSFFGQGFIRFDAPATGLPSFDEIVVRFHLEEPRALHSARVAIERFDLVP